MIIGNTYEFARKSISDDYSSFYKSARYALGCENTIDIQSFCLQIADKIQKRPSIQNIVFNKYPQYQTIEPYVAIIKQCNIVDIEPEARALASLTKTRIKMVSVRKTDEGKFNINITSYDDDENVSNNYDPSKKECIYILNDVETKHFDALVLRNKHDHTNEITRFLCTDDTVNELLHKFIADNFKDENRPRKRKSTDSDEDRSTSSPTLQKRASVSSDTSEPWSVQQLLDSISDSPSASVEELSMFIRFEREPRETFRGRTDGELKPLSSITEDGQPIEARAPTYVLDSKKRRLTLLISEKCFRSALIKYALKICIVTRDINGYTYYNPYFKFQVDRYSNTIPNQNPIFLPINQEDLEDYSPGIKKLQLKLVVVKEINRDLKDCQQPLDIFSSPHNPIEPPITTIYSSYKPLKATFHLHDIRFAIVLCEKQPSEEDFQPTNIQCISAVSTEIGKDQHASNSQN